MSPEIERLKQVLQKENQDNYRALEFNTASGAVISHKERLLESIESAVFGKARIQKQEFEKLAAKKPQYKSGLDAYK